MSISTPHPNSVSPDYSDSLPSITQDNCETSGDPHPSGNIGESDDFSALSGRHFDAKNFLSSTAFATPDSHDDVGNPIQTPNFTSIMTESATNGSFLPAPSSTGCLPTPSNQRGRKNFITRFYQTQMGSPQLSSAPEILSASPHSGKSTTETPARPTCRSEIFGSCPSVYNPFESFMLDSLHKNTFSPSVFAKVLSPSAEDSEEEGDGFRWSIDHIAIINPTEFDHESHELCYEELSRVDPETEAKVQAAIDQYFSQPNVLPSPWSLETNHRRKIFSPAVTDSINRKNLILMKKVPMAHSEAVRSARTVACQTALTIPFDIDLTKLLGDKFRYNEDSEGDVNEPSEREGRKSDDVNVSLGSLRRKLFSANCEHDSFNNDAEAEGKLKEMQSAADNLEGQTSLSQVTPSKDFSGDSDTLFDDTVSQASVHLDNISSSPVTMGMFSGIDFSMRLGRTSTSPTECKNDLISPEISPIRSLNGHHNSIKTSLTFGSCEDANFSFACSNDIVIRESPRSYVNLLTTGRFEGSNAEVSVGGNVDMRDCSTFQPSQ